MKLEAELVPKTSWYNNVRSQVTNSEWVKLRNKSSERAGHVCEMCGETGLTQGTRHKVECHEIWEYDDVNLIQKLTGLISLCPDCHSVKHPGLAGLVNRTHVVIRKLMQVNNISKEQAYEHLNEAFKVWAERSKLTYTIDTTCLKDY